MRNKRMTDENKDNQTESIVLGVFIHCEGCSDKVVRSLREFEGVEGIEIDSKNHKVIVKGKHADPTKVARRLMKKTAKHVELISPEPTYEETKDEKKTPELVVIEVELNMYIHCEGCAKDVKSCIHKMKGVQTVDVDMAKNQVKIKGTMDSEELLEFVNKKCGRTAEIVRQSDVKMANAGCTCTHNHHDQQMIYAPQMFSDENPNACSVM